LTAGGSIFLPRKVPHASIKVSEKGKMIVIMQPAGKLENFFVAVAVLKKNPHKKKWHRFLQIIKWKQSDRY
jgi:hypothetical protein